MKQCPACKRSYDDETLNFCLDDRSRLAAIDDRGEPATLMFDGPLGETTLGGPLHQDIQFCTASDGVSIAYATIGSGPMLVRVLGHFTHLEMEWEWPDLRHFWEELATRFTVVRYDGRGTGLSDRHQGEFTEKTPGKWI